MPSDSSPVTMVSPAPKTCAEKQNEVLMKLIAETDEAAIKMVLRYYDPSMTDRQLQKSLQKGKVAELEATLKFLRIEKDKDDKKPHLINKLIVRIQSLFPDTCYMCKNEYTIRRTDTPLLECIRCTQGIHSQCLASKLGVPEVDLEGMTPEEVTNKLNPYGLQTLTFLCGTCYSDFDSGLTPPPINSLQLTETAAAEGEDNTEATQQSSSETGNAELLANPSAAESSESDTESDDADIESESEDEAPRRKKQSNAKKSNDRRAPKQAATCSFYLKGKCKHGISGKGCSFSHPQFCKKLMTFGTTGKRGCTKGRDCNKTHPKMCTSSLKSRECLNDACTSYHVKGTRRKNSKPVESRRSNQQNRRHTEPSAPQRYYHDRNSQSTSSSTQSHQPIGSNTNNTHQAFLEILDAWSQKFMNCLNQKLQLNQLISQPTATQVNHQPSQLNLNQLLRQTQGAVAANPAFPF